MENLNEVFDSDSAKNYPVTNLKPGSGIPQIFSIQAPGNDNLVARMVSYASQGDAIKMVKPGDKYVHVILMSLSAKGTPAELKGGLGSDPLGTLNTIFDTIYEQVKALRMDAVLFRFPTKKMKGKGPTVQRVLARLAMARTGGKFKVVDDMYQFTGKHTYVLLVRKQANIEDIKGMPEIDADLYTKVESKVGEVYVSKKTGQSVTKIEALSASIAAVEEKRTDKAVITTTKISRRAVAAAQYSPRDEVPEGWNEIDAEASKFSAPATAELIDDYEELEIFIQPSETNTMERMRAADMAMRANGVWKEEIRVEDSDPIFNRMHRELKRAPVGSMKQMQIFAESCAEVLNLRKAAFIERKMNEAPPNMDAAEYAAELWEQEYAQRISAAVTDFANEASESVMHFTASYSDNRFEYEQREAISSYCGQYYTDVNNYLLGNYYEEDAEFIDSYRVIEVINDMDAAFEIGHKLPPDITLWRGQYLNVNTFDKIKHSKLFYFRNYVSTSLKPIIFGGWVSNVAMAAVHQDYRVGTSFQGDNEIVLPSMLTSSENTMMNIGWKISGADSINVIVPGELSGSPTEQEVILPRGTTVKITKITDASYKGNYNTKLLEADIQTTDQLAENAVIYDGDALMETGELVVYQGVETETDNPVSFDSFVKSTKVDIMPILASCINFDETPEKFTQG